MLRAAGVLVAFIAGVVLGVAYLHVRADPPPKQAEAVRAWLQHNPEFLADNQDLVKDAQRVARSREVDNEVHWRRQLVADRWQKYLDPVFTPTLGNRSVPTVLVEFTDYACEPCRASALAVKSALERHPNIRIALYLLPTTGDLSEYAARVAFAGYRQNPERFPALHDSLLSMTGPLTSAAVLQAAQKSGLDTEQIEVDLRSAEVRQYIARSTQFAQDLQVAGVPFFLLDGRTLAGGISATKLSSFVE